MFGHIAVEVKDVTILNHIENTEVKLLDLKGKSDFTFRSYFLIHSYVQQWKNNPPFKNAVQFRVYLFTFDCLY